MPKFVNLIAFQHVVVIMEFPDWVQVKMKILQSKIAPPPPEISTVHMAPCDEAGLQELK